MVNDCLEDKVNIRYSKGTWLINSELDKLVFNITPVIENIMEDCCFKMEHSTFQIVIKNVTEDDEIILDTYPWNDDYGFKLTQDLNTIYGHDINPLDYLPMTSICKVETPYDKIQYEEFECEDGDGSNGCGYCFLKLYPTDANPEQHWYMWNQGIGIRPQYIYEWDPPKNSLKKYLEKKEDMSIDDEYCLGN